MSPPPDIDALSPAELKSLAYRDLGEAYLDQIGQTRTVANLKRRLERLGYRVTLEPKAKPA